ncbi:prolyl oligopeptidase family serine peptidase [uncultured Psychroserpens sp.]|uniref:S9 family peptidase n=1 Tax=uncultured Psychroserpens sp. TaxID=255436 RepID=UPI0026031A06|nr:prolyl oligopeptidase family serine peptidase [uncultured Psychroserpens sp.]
MKLLYCFLIGIGISLGSVQAQNISQEDYKRAVSFMFDNYNNKTAFNLYTPVNWFEDGNGLWFIDYSEKGKSYKTVNFEDYKVTPLFDHMALAKALSGVSKNPVDASQLPIRDIARLSKKELSFSFEGKDYTYHLKNDKLSLKTKELEEVRNLFETKSPDGKWTAYVRDYNVYVKSVASEKEYQLSVSGQRNYEYGSWYGWYDKMEGENGERPKRFYVDWSQDSKWIATSLVDLRTAEKMYLLDYSIDSLYKPKLLSYYRGSPGDTTMVYVEPVFFNVETKTEIKTDLPKGTHINSVSTQWTDKSGVLLARYPERGYQKEYVKLVDLNSNTIKTIIEETSETNIDNFEYRFLEQQQKVLFLSERSGWRQLYLYDLKTNETKALTQGEYYVANIEYVDEKKGLVYLLINGKETGNNPYHHQLYKADFKGNITCLTPKLVNHQITFSEDGTYFTDNYSTINLPTTTVLRDSESGEVLTELTKADVSEALAMGWQSPEVFELTAKDGKTTIYGALWKPTTFDPSKKYPIIDHTYTGPHTKMFPESFSRGFMNQSLAELGFIVIMVDGLGTSKRSKSFHNYSYKNMGNNLEDHVLAIEFLGKKHPWIDTNRVGVFGHSAGGFDTGRAMLAFPEVYKVGVASSADHDFRMEKAWWPEMYQGWPVDESYQEVSNITNASNLKGKLLLVHGGLDDNVNPSATFKLADALVKADKEFDLLILPSQRHGYRGKQRLYFIKKRWNYFIEHLRGDTPLWDFKWE